MDEFYETLTDEALKEQFDRVVRELARARLSARKGEIELELQELSCRENEEVVDGMKENYDTLVKIMVERSGD